MALPIIQGITQDLLNKVISLVAHEVTLVWGLKDELRKLQRTLVSIRAVITDAEQRQSHEQKLRVWLDNLRDVLYDSENVLDEFEIEAQRNLVIEQGNLLAKTRYFLCSSNPLAFRLRMGHKIKGIRRRLDEITTEKDAFNLNHQTFGSTSRSTSRETHSRVNVSEVIGRDDERDEIVKRLLSPDTDKNPFIISIVGIGGMGKTTMAKLVYNDDRVKLHFDTRIWVCVSDGFDVKTILQKVIKSAIPESTFILRIHLLEVEQLQAKLHQLLQDKRFLLVLDDVWSDNPGRWRELRDLLAGGAKGSSIIVTTRNSEVASAGASSYEHKLKGLSQSDCLDVFKKTLENGHGSVTNPELQDIAGQIVEKCGGVPLVVKALGGMLRSNTDIKYWRSIIDIKGISTVLQKESDVLRIIRLSYDHLPPHLKRCFAFCSIFPKDFVFSNIILGQCWMAIGLIGSSDNDQNPEEVCDEYITELSGRSFFQDFEEFGAYYEFKMHDLVHDLALVVGQNEYAVVKSDTTSISDRVRHLSFSDSPDNQLRHVPPLLSRVKKLQTLLCFQSNLVLSRGFWEACVSNCKYLRILALTNSTSEDMPKYIDTLKHLRVLWLTNNINIKRLPKTFCNLQSLRFFDMGGCVSLEELPRDMWKLINLQHLSMSTRQKSLKSTGVQYLKSLWSLWISGCNNLETLFGGMNMEGLTSLRHLNIYGCESLTSIPVGSLKSLIALEYLFIGDCGKLALSMEEGEDEIFLCLRALTIVDLPMMSTLPKWILGAAETLKFLAVINCQQLEGLPEWLPKLSRLETLVLGGCVRVLDLPDGVQDLTALKFLKVDDCGELGGRCRLNGPDWHKIAHIPKIEIVYHKDRN